MSKRIREPRGPLSTARYRLTCAENRIERATKQLTEDQQLIKELKAEIDRLDKEGSH